MRSDYCPVWNEPCQSRCEHPCLTPKEAFRRKEDYRLLLDFAKGQVIKAIKYDLQAGKIKQEPVGWYDSLTGLIDFTSYRPVRKPSSPSAEWVPVYTAPSEKEWVGLTEAEIVEISGGGITRDERMIARAIEKRLKEKNCG